MMYWNLRSSRVVSRTYILEPKHMMYWNSFFCNILLFFAYLNRNIWCIEISNRKEFIMYGFNLNRNIWCIEINKYLHPTHHNSLEPKHMMYWNNELGFLDCAFFILNRNIWCIEIKIWNRIIYIYFYLNRNIWCIEILNNARYKLDTNDLNRNIWCIEIG